MAAHAAVRLRRMTANLARIVGIEALCAAQGIEFRAPLQTSPALQDAVARIRARIPALRDDRILSADIETAAELVTGGALCDGFAFPGLSGPAVQEARP